MASDPFPQRLSLAKSLVLSFVRLACFIRSMLYKRVACCATVRGCKGGDSTRGIFKEQLIWCYEASNSKVVSLRLWVVDLQNQVLVRYRTTCRCCFHPSRNGALSASHKARLGSWWWATSRSSPSQDL